MLPILSIQNLGKSYGAKSVFENLSLIIQEREKIGLIGHNGTGKSTLLKILAGIEYPDDGEIVQHKKLQIAYLPQNPVFSDGDTPQSVVAKALTPQRERIAAYELICDEIAHTTDDKAVAELSHRQSQLQGEIEAHGGWELQHDIDNMMRRLGLDPQLYSTPMTALSGGQQRRVALARVLLERPDVLLLDEPTNHLDISSCEALENALLNYDGTLFIISHDRYLINKLADRVYKLNKTGAENYLGNYDYYLEKSAEIVPKIEEKKPKKSENALDYKQKKERESERRKLNTRVNRLEAEIEELDAKINELNAALSELSDYQKALEMSEELEEIRKRQEAAMEEWEAATAALEEFDD